MQGPPSPPEMKGVIPNAINHIFESISASQDVEFLVRCSYLELYNEEINDLLGDTKNPAKCEIKEDPDKGVFIKGLSNEVVENENDMNKLLDRGFKNRTVAATQMNAESSRSHSLFTIVIEMSSTEKESGKEIQKQGKLNLVDLAGSERQKKTGASGDRLKEGSKINLSLSALGNVISALSEGKSGHIPYRDSKLTRLLQDSLGGNTKTLMIAAISPASSNFDETLSTLRYANRAKNIKNKPKINEDPKDSLLREYKQEIEKLRQELLAHQASLVSSGGQGGTAHSGGMLDFASMISSAPSTGATELNFAAMAVGAVSLSGSDTQKATEELLHAKRLLEQHSVEKDTIEEKLKQKESEIEEERKIREELMQRMQQLQHKMVGHKAGSETASEQHDREEAQKRHQQRMEKIKKRKDLQQKMRAKLQQILEEKQAMEEELIGLRSSIESKQGGDSDRYEDAAVDDRGRDLSVKQIKKFEKKINSLKMEMHEMREEFEYEKDNLIDNMREQAKDVKLYEQICRAILSDKEFKKAVERSQWSEETDEWLIPALKRRDFVAGVVVQPVTQSNSGYSSISHSGAAVSYSTSGYGQGGGAVSSSGGFLPDITGATRGTFAGNNSNLPTLAKPPRDKKEKKEKERRKTRDPDPDDNGSSEYDNDEDFSVYGNQTQESSISTSKMYAQPYPPAEAKRPSQMNQYPGNDDRVEYNPSMAKLQNFSRIVSGSGSGSGSTLSTRPPSGGPTKISQMQSQVPLLYDKENNVKKSSPAMSINAANKPVAVGPSGIDEEGTGDFAGPLTEWGFAAIPGEEEDDYSDNMFEEDVVAVKTNVSKTKAKKERRSRTKSKESAGLEKRSPRPNAELTSLPPI